MTPFYINWEPKENDLRCGGPWAVMIRLDSKWFTFARSSTSEGCNQIIAWYRKIHDDP